MSNDRVLADGLAEIRCALLDESTTLEDLDACTFSLSSIGADVTARLEAAYVQATAENSAA